MKNNSGIPPAKILKYIIKETAKHPRYNNQNNSDNDRDCDIESIYTLSQKEQQKWMNVILGKTELNMRDTLNNSINIIKMIHNNDDNKCDDDRKINSNNNSNDNSDDVVLNHLNIIHETLDKNEIVLIKTDIVPILLEYILNGSNNIDISLKSCKILNDATQNNPSMQHCLFALNGVDKIVHYISKIQSNDGKVFELKIKLWMLVLYCIQNHNPNMNIFLKEKGYLLLNKVFMNINEINIKNCNQIFRVSRIVHYMLGEWNDGNHNIFQIINIFKPIFNILELYKNYLLTNKNNKLNDILYQYIIDTMTELIEGLSHFMSKHFKSRQHIIINHRNIMVSLKSLKPYLLEF